MIPICFQFLFRDDMTAHVVAVDDDREAFAIRDERGSLMIGVRTKTLGRAEMFLTAESAEALWNAMASAMGYELR